MRATQSLAIAATTPPPAAIAAATVAATPEKPKKAPRPNDACWCGKATKYKKCHGSIEAAKKLK